MKPRKKKSNRILKEGGRKERRGMRTGSKMG